MPVAALVALPFGLSQATGHLSVPVLLLCGALALPAPVIPYALELSALRRLNAGTFGTLMSVEPAAALLVGAVMLRQIPGLLQLVGVLVVTVAAVGASSAQRVSDAAIAHAQV
jgi:inner membrane transporter RhtA